MKELDLVLMQYLQQRWPHADPAERAAFEALLELPDPELAGYLLGHAVPPESLRTLVDALRHRA